MRIVARQSFAVLLLIAMVIACTAHEIACNV